MVGADRRRVLFVEDVSGTRELIEWSLGQQGFAVTGVETADEGLRLARAGNFDLILLDVGLPDKDGLEVCREIRTFDQRTPVLFYTVKKEGCWERVKDMYLNAFVSESLLIDNENLKFTRKEDKKNKQLESGIEMQMFAVNLKRETWVKLFDYYKKHAAVSAISSTQLDILHKMSTGILTLPSEKQSKILYQLYEKASEEGFAA